MIKPRVKPSVVSLRILPSAMTVAGTQAIRGHNFIRFGLLHTVSVAEAGQAGMVVAPCVFAV